MPLFLVGYFERILLQIQIQIRFRSDFFLIFEIITAWHFATYKTANWRKKGKIIWGHFSRFDTSRRQKLFQNVNDNSHFNTFISYFSEPLSILEYYQTNTEVALNPPEDPTRVITSFDEVPESIRNDSIKTMELLRNMPNQITSR